MDKRLIVELLPGPAFLIGNAFGGIFLGAALATAATAGAIAFRWRWDQALPLMALSILVLTLVLLTAGLAFDDATYIKVSNTIGSIVFAIIIACGMGLRPSLLRRTLGYTVQMTHQGWRLLHVTWIFLSLTRAVMNETMWRNFSDQTWAIYNGVSDVAWIGLFIVVTSVVARRYWEEPE